MLVLVSVFMAPCLTLRWNCRLKAGEYLNIFFIKTWTPCLDPKNVSMSNLKFLTSPSLKGFVRSETDISCHCLPHVDLPNSNETFGRPQIHQFVKSDLSSYILSLIFAAANPGGEIFVRSFLSPFPQGSAVPFSSCSNSLGYASLITSLPPSPQSSLFPQ